MSELTKMSVLLELINQNILTYKEAMILLSGGDISPKYKNFLDKLNEVEHGT